MKITDEQIDRLLARLRLRYPAWDGFAHPAFQADEVDYKQEAAAQMADQLGEGVLRGLLEDGDTDELIRRLERIGHATNLLWLRAPLTGDQGILYQPGLDKPAFCRQVVDLLYGPDEAPERLGRYVAYVKAQGLPNKWTFPTYLLFLRYPEAELFVKPEVTRFFLKFVDAPFKLGMPSAESYARLRQFAYDLKEALAAYGPRDMIDVQSVIWVCGRKEPADAPLAAPFGDLFSDREEAEWAFDFLRETLGHLGVEYADDPRVALTLPRTYHGHVLRLNFGQWVVLDFCGPEARHHGVNLALLADRVDLGDDIARWDPFSRSGDEPEIRVYEVPTDLVRDGEAGLLETYAATLAVIAKKFGTWQGSPHSKAHQPKLFEAVFDPAKRKQLFAAGLSLTGGAMRAQTFEEAIASFDRADYADRLRAAEEERQAILQRFPLEAWPQLPLERYAIGQEDSSDTYCYWMEFGALHLGSMRGGSALKHLIYKHKDKSGWYFSNQYATKEEAWSAIRDGFVRALALAGERRWEEIDGIAALLGGRALRSKTLHVYFPDEILPINSYDHIVHYLTRLEAYRDELKDAEIVVLNRSLLEVLRGYPALRDWTTLELAKLLYAWADPRQTKRVVKIAPGPDAAYWKDCLEGGYICVGWDDLGDLRAYESKRAFRDRFGALYLYEGNKSTVTKKANELWTLVQLEPGDIVIANQGTTKVLAVGEVVEPGYAWREDREEYKHTVHVRWDTTYEQTVPPQKGWAFAAVKAVPAALYQQILSWSGLVEVSPAQITIDPAYLEAAEALERKGQLIFYGPPGTGKTYFARRFAAWWLVDRRDRDAAGAVLADDDRLSDAEGQLTAGQRGRRFWWVVANPKQWTWDQLFAKGREPFRKGRLQRNYAQVAPGDLVFGYQGTPEQRLVAMARVTKGLGDLTGEAGFEVEPVRKIQGGPTYADLKADPVLGASEPMRHNCQGTLFALTEREAGHVMRRLEAGDPGFDASELHGDGVGQLTWTTFHPSYSYEDFVEGFRPVDVGTEGLSLHLEDGLFKRICREALAHPAKPYLLVIDEINRANIAKVFGELITLLERDKRGLSIVLPQSKERFVVPPNVYVVGTMNTADRSIRLLDAALRRRFAFIERMPDATLLEGAVVEGLYLDVFLETLNQRISAREGREKQIGHSFLMEGGHPLDRAGAFCARFRQEILPLLQEYCYDDYRILAEYLGEALVDRERQRLRDDILSDDAALIEALIKTISEEGTTAEEDAL